MYKYNCFYVSRKVNKYIFKKYVYNNGDEETYDKGDKGDIDDDGNINNITNNRAV